MGIGAFQRAPLLPPWRLLAPGRGLVPTLLTPDGRLGTLLTRLGYTQKTQGILNSRRDEISARL